MIWLGLIIILSVSCANAATNYILRSASGTASGADWVNAFTNLPATLTRGDVYLIGDGDDYGSYNFNDAVSGTSYIRLQKATAAVHGTDTGWDNGHGDGQAVFRQIQIDRAYHIIDGSTGTSNSVRGIKIDHDSTVSGFGGIYMTSTFTDSGEKRQIHLLNLELTQPAGDKHGDSSFYLYMNDTNGSWSDPILVVSNCWSHDIGGLNYKHNVGGWFLMVNNYFETCCGLDSAGHKELAKWDSTNSHARIYGNVFKDWQGFSVTGGLVIGGEATVGYFRDWQIYNNLFVWTDRTSPGGTNIWSGGSRAVGGLDSAVTDHDDVHVWNNTFVNITDSTAANIFQNGTWTGSYTASNNLFVACPGLNTINTSTKGSNAVFQCTNYTPGTHEFTLASDPLTDSGNGEAHLSSDPGIGMDLSDFFATDFEGSERPPWTLGAFAFSSGFIPTIVTNTARAGNVGFLGLRLGEAP